MPRPHYSGAATALVWVGAVAFGITFWAGVICIARSLYNSY